MLTFLMFFTVCVFGILAFPHWHSQAHEAWYSLWYVIHDFGLLCLPEAMPLLTLPPFFSCLGTNSLSSPT